MIAYHSKEQLALLIMSALILFAAITFYHFKREKLSMILLLLGALSLGAFVAQLNPFLNLWDEQYHALVAKNMMHNPLYPVLYANPLLGYDYTNWGGNHVWLHKQPLFLWQMALSIKIFGINELAVRIPSILMHGIIPILIYRIGKIALNSNIGFYGALFFAVAYYPLELAAGTYGTDHNDIAFLFYVCASFWAWFEYQNSEKKYWLILIGLFAGCAVLVKWLVGLLIYSVWVIADFVKYKSDLFSPKTFLKAGISLIVSVITILPWQLYILGRFPLEANHEYSLNTKHFFQDVEGHTGGFLFHFDALKRLYGEGDLVPYLVLAGLIILAVKANNKVHRIALLAPVVIVYCFFTIAKTKIASFGLVVSPFIFLALASLINFALEFIGKKIKYDNVKIIISSLILICISYFLFDINKIQKYHTFESDDNRNRRAELSQMNLIEDLKTFQDAKYVIFNSSIRLNGHIPVMFYTDHIAYDFIPSEQQLATVLSKGYTPVIIDFGNIPDYIKNNKNIITFKFKRNDS